MLINMNPIKAKTKSRGVEKLSYPIIKASFERRGGFYHKIADQGYISPGSGNRFTPSKPFDIMGLYNGVHYYIEMKGTRTTKRLSYEDLRESQVEAFTDIEVNKLAADKALVGYYFYIPRKLKKILFVNYQYLLEKGTIPKKEVDQFLQEAGDVHGENYIDENGVKKRRHFIHIEDIGKYIIG